MNVETRELRNPAKPSSTIANSEIQAKREPGEITQLFRIVEDKIVAENIDDEVQVELAIVVSLLARMEKSGNIGDN